MRLTESEGASLEREITDTIAELTDARQMLEFAEDEFVDSQCEYIESLESKLNGLYGTAKREYMKGAQKGEKVR